MEQSPVWPRFRLETADPPRYTLLDTARHYALGRLAANGELQAARGRMAAAVLEPIDLAYEEYRSVDEEIWLREGACISTEGI